MINKIFFDNDQTLSHSMNDDPEQEHIIVTALGESYYTIVRPSAVKLIQFSRDLVGIDNVYMLTSAIREHAEQINEKAGFEFVKDRIFTREDMDKNTFNGAYGAYHYFNNSDIADKNNVLIDNLPHYYNTRKMQYIGINKSRYLQIYDYYGVNNHETEFFEDVTEFLLQKNREV